jgi:hypothetical protein
MPTYKYNIIKDGQIIDHTYDLSLAHWYELLGYTIEKVNLY